jgi:hypothetical protein
MNRIDNLTKDEKIGLLITVAPTILKFIENNPNNKAVNNLLSSLLSVSAINKYLNAVLELIEEEE